MGYQRRYLPAGCDCYVQYLPEETLSVLRYGAHNPTCPAYRMSLDYVDRVRDREFRTQYEER